MSGEIHLEHDWFGRPVPKNVEIGEGSYLDSTYSLLHFHSRRSVGLRIGKRSGVYVETFFNLGPNGMVKIGDHCTLAGPVICTNHRVTIGDYVLISREVIIADRYDARPYDPAVSESVSGSPPGDIVVGDYAWLGTRAILLAGARLGTGAIAGAGAVIDFDVPDYAIAAGNPARVVGWAKPKDRQLVFAAIAAKR